MEKKKQLCNWICSSTSLCRKWLLNVLSFLVMGQVCNSGYVAFMPF